jgi:hypothetical protein
MYTWPAEVLMRTEGFLLLVFFSVGSSPGGPVGQGLVQVPASCATTRPDSSTFVPPPPYAPVAPFRSHFWYGTEAL